MVVQEWLSQSSITEIRNSMALMLGVAVWHALSFRSWLFKVPMSRHKAREFAVFLSSTLPRNRVCTSRP